MNVKPFNEYVNENYTDQYFYHGSPHVFDRFDMAKVGSGDGLSKFGHGLYFADTVAAAKYYAQELSIGKLRATGCNLYTVRLTRLADYVAWEGGLNDGIIRSVCRVLENTGHEDSADEILEEYRSYGDYSMDSLYTVVASTVGSEREATEIMYEAGIAGVIADHMFLECKVYVAYSDRNTKIINSEQLSFDK